MRSTALSIAIVISFSSLTYAQAVPEAAKGAEETARRALVTFGKLVTSDNYSAMGFDAPGDAKTAELGVPLEEYMIRLDDLRQYEEGADPERLLKSTGQLIYPVILSGGVRSSLTLNNASGEWTAVAYGNPSLIKLLDESRSKMAERPGGSQISYFAVHVAALNVYFLGHREDQKLMFTPLMDDAPLGLEKGEPLPAEEVLQLLVPRAREQEDVPS